MGCFKSLTTNQYIKGVRKKSWSPFNKKLWQRNFYDRIIRNSKELNQIRRYIKNNPLKWNLERDGSIKFTDDFFND
ncbi:hypothetical protein MWH25_07210 [Natroniella acetigena]|nr:hypothetical protein [Natroniella acetigena]